MPTKVKLQYLPLASQDFEEIVKYHITQVGVAAARNIYRLLETEINRLASYPLLGQIHPDPILAAQDIVTGREFPIDIGAFGKDRWFVYVAAFGLFTGVSYQTPQEDKQVLGRLAYFLHGVKALGEVKPIHARVEFENQALELDVLDGLVCSTTSVGGVLALDSLGISLNDGQSELLLVRDIKNLIDFNNVSTALLKSDFRENENIVSKKVRRVHFTFDTPVDWSLDGEYGGTVTDVEIVNHQRAVNIIVPR